jgi:hypothetical protein
MGRCGLVRGQWRSVVNTVMGLRVTYSVGILLLFKRVSAACS